MAQSEVFTTSPKFHHHVHIVPSSIQWNKLVRGADNLHTETSVCINQLQGQEETLKIYRWFQGNPAKQQENEAKKPKTED